MTDTSTAEPATQRRPVPAWVALALSLIGLAAAGYLAYEHGTGTTTLACPETGVVNCVKVTTSSYSRILGIPVAYLGVAFFVALVVLCVAELASARRAFAVLRLAASSAGMVGVAYLVWAEVRLHAICLWCTAVHVTTFLLFVLSVFTEALRVPGDELG
jgi:uncharacterized membrane protein